MNPIECLIHELAKLPGIGERTATRLAFFILRSDNDYARALVEAIGNVKKRVHLCSECQNLTETDPCSMCADQSRDTRIICAVSAPSDVMAVERSQSFRGRYHILHGALSPLDGVGPDDIKVAELLQRLKSGSVQEVIIATNADVEGESTALYLSKAIKKTGIKTTRLACGMPVGGALEYIDASTLSRAFEERKEV